MMTLEQVTEMLNQGYDCGQVVLYSAAEKLGLDKAETLRLAAGFGGGMFAGESCGAVVGGIIALGYAQGHWECGDMETKGQFCARVTEFRTKVIEKLGSTMCRDILGYNVGIPEQFQKVMELNLLQKHCPGVVYQVVEILDSFL